MSSVCFGTYMQMQQPVSPAVNETMQVELENMVSAIPIYHGGVAIETGHDQLYEQGQYHIYWTNLHI